jgi:hypothetical protein
MYKFRFERQRRRTYALVLDITPGVGGYQQRIGSVGSVPNGLPVRLAPCAQFWVRWDGRWGALVERYPSLAPYEEAFADACAKRIPVPTGPVGERALRIAEIQIELEDALNAIDRDQEDVIDAAEAGDLPGRVAVDFLEGIEAEAREIERAAAERIAKVKAKGKG